MDLARFRVRKKKQNKKTKTNRAEGIFDLPRWNRRRKRLAVTTETSLLHQSTAVQFSPSCTHTQQGNLRPSLLIEWIQRDVGAVGTSAETRGERWSTYSNEPTSYQSFLVNYDTHGENRGKPLSLGLIILGRNCAQPISMRVLMEASKVTTRIGRTAKLHVPPLITLPDTDKGGTCHLINSQMSASDDSRSFIARFCVDNLTYPSVECWKNT